MLKKKKKKILHFGENYNQISIIPVWFLTTENHLQPF